jgi:hypothetical protein
MGSCGALIANVTQVCAWPPSLAVRGPGAAFCPCGRAKRGSVRASDGAAGMAKLFGNPNNFGTRQTRRGLKLPDDYLILCDKNHFKCLPGEFAHECDPKTHH